MLDRNIDADKYNALPEEIKAHYVKRGGSYTLDVSGTDPELAVTQTALDKARKDAIELGSQVRNLTAEASSTEERVRSETAKQIKELTDANTKLVGSQIETERNRHVDAIATKFKTEGLIRADLSSRVNVEIVNGEVKTTFKDKNGNAVDFKTLDDEYCKNPDYSVILKDGKSTSTFTPPAGGTSKDKPKANPNSGTIDYATATAQEVAAYLENSVT